MASANKYKSLAMKLYNSIEDLKSIMKTQNTWRQDEINKLVLQNAKRRDSCSVSEETSRLKRKMDFQRAITITDGKSAKNFKNFRGGKSPQAMAIEEIESDDDSTPSKAQEDMLEDEEKILAQLFRTTVDYR